MEPLCIKQSRYLRRCKGDSNVVLGVYRQIAPSCSQKVSSYIIWEFVGRGSYSLIVYAVFARRGIRYGFYADGLFDISMTTGGTQSSLSSICCDESYCSCLEKVL